MTDTESMIVFRYRNRDSELQELEAEAFAFDSELCLYAVGQDDERRFVGQLQGERLNVCGEEWNRLEFHGALEVRQGAERQHPYGAGLSIGLVWDEPRLYDRQGAGRTLGGLGRGEILICPIGFRHCQKARRLSALAS